MRSRTILLLILLYSTCSGQLPEPKNIIILIGDGMGYNHIAAAGFYKGEKLVFENFPVKTAVATYPALAGEYEPGNPASNYISSGYNPSLAWKDTAYLKKDYTESAAAATALATGVKTYNNAIGLSVSHDTLENLTEWAKNTGRSTGVVTSVPFSHATPAGFVTHNVYRANYPDLAKSMILKSKCDVIMGCGNPAYNDNCEPVSKWKAKYAGDSIFWRDLTSGKDMSFSDADGDGKPDKWVIIQNAEDFIKLKKGKTPKRVLGCPKAGSVLQAGRKSENNEGPESLPYTTHFNKSVPSLADMTAGAINVLDNNDEGFFLMVEGGAIDWAAHSNLKGRLIEEMLDFDNTVKEVISWVEQNSNWNETLVIVTADHETGLLWGNKPFSPLTGNGKGKLPVMTFYSGNHTNSLVALYAKGSGSELLKSFADEYDPERGYFIQNTEIAQLIHFLWNEKD